MGTIDPTSSIDLENVITDFKKIKFSDFGYDPSGHFLEFLEVDRRSKWDFLFRQLFPGDKKRDTQYTKIVGKKRGRRVRKKRTKPEKLRGVNRMPYKQYLNVASPSGARDIKVSKLPLRYFVNF